MLTPVIARLSLTAVLILVALVGPSAAFAPVEAPQAPAAPQAEIAPNVWSTLARAAGGRVDIMVTLKEQADLSPAARLETQETKGRFVRDTLWATAETSQAALRAWLRERGIRFRPYYIVNLIQVEAADKALILELAARSDVARIAADPEFRMPEEQPMPAPDSPYPIEWNIQRTFAPSVWGMGYTGQNVVVGSHDSGVEWQHPALINQYRGWNGSTADHDYNWHDPFHEFQEPHGAGSHGTHTTGTAVGDDGAGNQIGMAPGAKWIACKNQNTAGLFKASVYIECFEWFMAPYPVNGDPSQGDPTKAPHVINNSWTCPTSEGCDPDTLRPAIDALLAAGIVYAKSAGNSGPSCGTITVPGHIPDVLATGAFDSSNTIASFSSRGPAIFDGEQIVKPNIAAPGVGVRSATGTNTYGTLSGTSMASPHTAGLVALLLSFRPDFKGHPDRVKQLVEISADGTTTGNTCGGAPGGRPNNTWGWGTINAIVMFGNATETGTGALSGTVTSGGNPVAGAAVQVTHQASGWSRRLTTDASGAYSTLLLAGNWTVTASHYGHQTQSANVVITNLGTTVQDFSLPPAPLWTLSGAVQDASNNAPLPAQVQLDRMPVTLMTDPATGQFSGQVAEGVYTMRVSSTGYTATQQVITVTQNLNLGALLLQPKAAYVAGCIWAYNWIDATDTPPINLADDANRQIRLAAPFTYHGISYTSLYVQADGFISFGSSYNVPYGNWIPAPYIPNNAVYAFWTDLNPNNGAQGQVYTKTLSSPTRTVIEWFQVQHWPSGDPETFEIILDHETGVITLQYQTVADASQATVGLEDRTGTDGVRLSYHQTNVIVSEKAFRMHPIMGRPTMNYDPCRYSYLPVVLK